MYPNKPLIIQSNNTLLLEVDNPLFTEARNEITLFAHLEKSPEHIHTYSITPLSLWNAASLGITPDHVIETLTKYSKYEIPQNVCENINELMSRFGKIILENYKEGLLVLQSTQEEFFENIVNNPKLTGLIAEKIDKQKYLVLEENRGLIKQTFISLGYPVLDKANYVDGEPFKIKLRKNLTDGKPFIIREYQKQAAESYIGKSDIPGGSGIVVLPCGAGKTIVGIYVMSIINRCTLILVTNVTAARQWKRELIEKTEIPAEMIGEYSSEEKEIKPITIATYQILTYRKKKTEPFIHYKIFNSKNWGLIIYDEVHLLPAPVFKFTAEIQARRRLGLTATLIREDGHESDVFSLIGPKKFDIPWKDLERQGWIATARCIEIRVDMSHQEKLKYFGLSPREQIRLAYENPRKIPIAKDLVKKHKDDQIIIIGQYLSQLADFEKEFGAPIITGATPNKQRDVLYDKFRKGEFNVLILSKVGNFAVDLPDANIAIQISGSFGSRQEEAQRLGRILRPKKYGEQAIFYSIVTRESRELEFAMNRQLFLTEQGYSYEIKYWEFNT
jgi:DNA excision repair protein ERCC-3